MVNTVDMEKNAPPSYNEHGQHELVQTGPPIDIHISHRNIEDDEYTPCEQCIRCAGVCASICFVFFIILGIVFLSCSCF